MQVYLDGSLGSYHRFLRIKSLPRYEIHGRTQAANSKTLFDHQEAVA